jgi:5-methylcytosine-specific restriction endonuclease McrA
MSLYDQIKQAERKVAIARRELLQVLTVAVVARDKTISCHYCGVETRTDRNAGPLRRTVDHVIPRKFGGDDTLDNLVLACSACNSKKGTQVNRSLLCPSCRGRTLEYAARETPQ